MHEHTHKHTNPHFQDEPDEDDEDDDMMEEDARMMDRLLDMDNNGLEDDMVAVFGAPHARTESCARTRRGLRKFPDWLACPGRTF